MGKNVIITGANRGIGKALVQKYAVNHCNIWACARKPDEEFEKQLKEMAIQNDIWIKPVYFELSEPESVKNGIMEILSEKIDIDVLVNNAGINMYNIFQMTKLSDARALFEIDFFAPFQIMQLVLKRMTKQRSGSIINISSIAALDAHSGDSVYGSAKAALTVLSKSLAIEVGQYNIRVNVVAPGPVETDMIKKNFEKIGDEVFSNSVSGRLARVDEIADVVYYLSSENASFINGQVIRVDGGIK